MVQLLRFYSTSEGAFILFNNNCVCYNIILFIYCMILLLCVFFLSSRFVGDGIIIIVVLVVLDWGTF